MNTSGDDCADEHESSNNPHILSESEFEERDMDTIPPPSTNPVTNNPDGSVHGSEHGTEPEGGDQEMGDPPANHVNTAAENATDPNSGANTAGAPAADPPAAAGAAAVATATATETAAGTSSFASCFGFGPGSGPSNPGVTPGGCGTSGTIDKTVANFSFCPTPANVKKLFSKKQISAEADATPSDVYENKKS